MLDDTQLYGVLLLLTNAQSPADTGCETAEALTSLTQTASDEVLPSPSIMHAMPTSLPALRIQLAYQG